MPSTSAVVARAPGALGVTGGRVAELLVVPGVVESPYR